MFFVNVDAYSQDSISFSPNTKVVLDHFSGIFQNQKKLIRLSSFFDENNIFYYNIYTIDNLSLALRPQPISYFKFKSLILIHQNYFYYIEHSKKFLEDYVADIKSSIRNDIEIDSYVPLKTHNVLKSKEIVVDGVTDYYCYKVKDGKILSFAKTEEPFNNECFNFHSHSY